MGGGELLEGAIALLSTVAAIVGLRRWGKFIAERPGAPRWAGWVGVVGATAYLLGILGTILGLVRAFAAVSRANVAPAEKSSELARGISDAMYSTAAGMLLLVVSVLLLLGLTWRYHWAASPIER